VAQRSTAVPRRALNEEAPKESGHDAGRVTASVHRRRCGYLDAAGQADAHSPAGDCLSDGKQLFNRNKTEYHPNRVQFCQNLWNRGGNYVAQKIFSAFLDCSLIVPALHVCGCA
jgi:hypothetical protein